jgi:hypothetical protein
MSPPNIIARRTLATGIPAAAAIASTMTPASAPWRSSPRSKRNRNRCSASVARPKRWRRAAVRSELTPAPRSAATSVIVLSVSVSESTAALAGVTSLASRNTAGPMPMRPCGA